MAQFSADLKRDRLWSLALLVGL
ncbi:MAG: hypothetical protein JWL62_1879, partial [Hyphomicrobiales bacterium]|nr:hypothetical protein [Hyphomicrobiales bacterium]